MELTATPVINVAYVECSMQGVFADVPLRLCFITIILPNGASPAPAAPAF
jgi:hypothetical protein